jgi:hypothetical protein
MRFSVKKKHIVLARNKKISDSGLELDGEKMQFKGKGAALWINDEGKAKALQQKYPRDVAVTLDQQYTWHANNEGGNGTRMDNIHHYAFGPMTSKAAEEFWERYEKKKKKSKPVKRKETRKPRRVRAEVRHAH